MENPTNFEFKGWKLMPLVVVLVAFSLVVVVSTGLLQQRVGSLLFNSIGVIASVFLATVTWLSLRQNRHLHEHQRQKPLYRDVIHLINNSVDILSNNQEELTENLSRWSREDNCLNTVLLKERFEPRDDIDPIARHRLKEEHPDLYNELIEHDHLVWEIRKQVRKLRRELKGPIRRYLDEIEPLDEDTDTERWMEKRNQRLNEVDKIVDGLMNFYHRWGREIETDLWIHNQSKFKTIAEDNAEDELDQLLLLEQQYYDKSNQLINDVLSLRNELQTEYGISMVGTQGSI